MSAKASCWELSPKVRVLGSKVNRLCWERKPQRPCSTEGVLSSTMTYVDGSRENGLSAHSAGPDPLAMFVFEDG